VNAVEAAGLAKRYRRTWRSRLAWALQPCTLAIPAGGWLVRRLAA
jgi:hypothetical protein